jgi:hypothetical protein
MKAAGEKYTLLQGGKADRKGGREMHKYTAACRSGLMAQRLGG